MTNWMPKLRIDDGPRYLQLARQIEEDIENGRLRAGDKLPPQRNLAFDIGVTVGTVGRAYEIVRQRGLVTGEVGRGTYVSGGTPYVKDTPEISNERGWYPEFTDKSSTENFDDLIRFDTSAATPASGAEHIASAMAQSISANPIAANDYVREITSDWQMAGVRWIAAGCDWRPNKSGILPTHGAHSAVMAIISAVTSPGDRIACEALTYATLPRAAQMIGRRIASVAMDEIGILPEAFEMVCAQQHPKLLFLMPALHNPTATTLPADRREDLVRIARAHNVLIIEDNVYGSVCPDPHPPIAALAPDITFHIGGLSKSVSAGLRAAWVSCPPNYLSQVLGAHKLMCGGKSFVLADVSARLVNSGVAESLCQTWRAEINARSYMLREHLPSHSISANETAPYIWLKLPDPWLSGTFKNAAWQSNVRIDDEDEYKAGRGEMRTHGVRIAFSVPRSRETVKRGAEIIAQLLASGPSAYHSFN